MIELRKWFGVQKIIHCDYLQCDYVIIIFSTIYQFHTLERHMFVKEAEINSSKSQRLVTFHL